MSRARQREAEGVMAGVTRIGDVPTGAIPGERRRYKEGRGGRFVGEVEPTLLPGSGRDTRGASTIVMRRAGGGAAALRDPEIAQEGDRLFCDVRRLT